jgi:hypothetical protein
LGNEEESQLDRVLLEDSMRILQDDWIIIVSPFEERNCDDRWDWFPKKKMLSIQA